MIDAAARMGRYMARRSSRKPYRLICSLSSLPSTRNGSLHSFLTKDDSRGAINPFPFAVVSLVSVSLTAPVTHQDQGLQKNEISSSATLVRFCGPRKSSVPDCVQFVEGQISGLLTNLSWLTAWAVKTLMT